MISTGSITTSGLFFLKIWTQNESTLCDWNHYKYYEITLSSLLLCHICCIWVKIWFVRHVVSESVAHLGGRSWNWRTESPRWGPRSRWHQRRTHSDSSGKEWQQRSAAPPSPPPQQGPNTRPHHCCSPHLGKWRVSKRDENLFEWLFAFVF